MEREKIALVTGAAGTMGKAVVQVFLRDGHTVIMTDIDRENLEQAAEEVKEAAEEATETAPKERIHLRCFDISDPAAVEREMAAVQGEIGGVDILVNNAGILSNNKAMETTAEEWNRVLAVNLSGAFYMSRAVLPYMRRQSWGRIINTSSYAAKSGGVTAGTSYSVSKGGMITLTFSLAAETVREGITVNGIAPAWVKTPMVTRELSEEQRRQVIAKIPVGRYCEPEEFAHVVRFLSSPLAGFITGEIIDLNGGIHFD
jgi:3-oxoacyl-[acyl-carrier protein] reductase